VPESNHSLITMSIASYHRRKICLGLLQIVECLPYTSAAPYVSLILHFALSNSLVYYVFGLFSPRHALNVNEADTVNRP
jgi:hypothetical protein